MTIRSEHSPGPSAYDGFLFASVHADAAGTDLTVLSALARLGIDPWEEAAWLADMPRAMAAKVLAASIARLPPGTWGCTLNQAEQDRIAERLVAALPPRCVPPARSAATPAIPPAIPQAIPSAPRRTNAAPAPVAEKAGTTMSARYPAWPMWSALALALYLLLAQMTPDRDLEFAGQETITQE